MVLWGPPGSGKTTLAGVIARLTRSRFVAMSAVTAGVADLRKVVEVARRTPNERTILFIDEIHRFNWRGLCSAEPRRWVRSEPYAPA